MLSSGIKFIMQISPGSDSYDGATKLIAGAAAISEIIATSFGSPIIDFTFALLLAGKRFHVLTYSLSLNRGIPFWFRRAAFRRNGLTRLGWI